MAETWWGVDTDVSQRLEGWGWSKEDESIRQYIPAIARHGNAVLELPPSPAWAVPALAAVATSITSTGGRGLILAPPAMVAPIGRTIARLIAGTPLRLLTATGPARAARRIALDTVDILVASPATALVLQTRSALAIDKLTSLVLAWPDGGSDDEALTLLLAELDKDCQRVILAGNTTAAAELTKRHLRRPLTVDSPPPPEEPAGPPRSVRTLATPWSSRTGAVTTALEILDPTSLAIWTVDRSEHTELALRASELPDVEIVTRGTVAAETVIFFDLPTTTEFSEVGDGKDVVLLVPPGTEGFVAGLASTIRPIRVTGASDLMRDADAGLREEIAGWIEDGDSSSASYALAPLFDRYDPQAIAAACLTLWRQEGKKEPSPAGKVGADQGSRAPAPTGGSRPTTPVGGIETAKVWVGFGRRDDASPGDLVAVLIKEIGLTREAIGRIELRESFSLVEVPKSDADRVAAGLSGATIKGRRLSARVDRGTPARSGDRGGPPRGDRGGPPRGDRGGFGRPQGPSGGR